MAFVLRNASTARPEMNITPLVDVMLVLLVIFMVTAPAPTHRVAMHLPIKCGPTCPEPKDDNIARLDILRGGQLRWDGELLARDTLDSQLQWHAKTQAPLTIASADDAAFADLASVLASVGQAGITKVRMAD